MKNVESSIERKKSLIQEHEVNQWNPSTNLQSGEDKRDNEDNNEGKRDYNFAKNLSLQV